MEDMRTLLPALAAAALALGGCASWRLSAQVDAGDVDSVKAFARKTPTIQGERALDVALRDAAQSGQAAMIPALIAAGADPDSGKITPTMYAARNGHATSIEALAAHGADVNRATPKYRRTALMYAARSADVDTVRALLARGADARAKDWAGQDAAAYARMSHRFDMLPLLEGAAAAPDGAPPKDAGKEKHTP
jgi:hypothetical protein